MEITSAANPKFKTWKECLLSKGIQEHGLCLVSGEKIVSEMAENHADSIRALLLNAEMKENSVPNSDIGADYFVLANSLFKELDELGTKSPILVMQTAEIKKFETQEPRGLEVVLPLSDPANLGAAIRSCLGLFVDRIILTQEAANPYLPKALRSASGANWDIELLRAPSLKDWTLGPSDWTLDMDGAPIGSFKRPKNMRLIVGLEGQGIPASLKMKQSLSLPMNPKLESFNAAMALTAALAVLSKN